MRYIDTVAFAAVVTLATSAVAQQPAPAEQPAPAQAPAPVTATLAPGYGGTTNLLPANTEVMVTLNSEVSSKKAKVGDRFDVSVARDVMLGNYIVIPRGTRGNGVVTYRTGKGAFGKSAKMEIEIRSITLNGREIPLSGKFRQEGQGNTGATVGAAVAVGVFSAFVTGRSAVFEQGRELRTFTVESLPIAAAGTR